jgi:hypothetical protein
VHPWKRAHSLHSHKEETNKAAIGTLIFFKYSSYQRVGAAYFPNNKTIHISLKNRISGFRRYYGYTYQSSQCPDTRNSEVGLSLIMIIEPLSRDYHFLIHRTFTFRESHLETPFERPMCEVAKSA